MSSTPAETQLERQTRLAFAGAAKAYRMNMAEQNRLFKTGGSKTATTVMEETSSGQYLEFVVGSLRQANKDGWHTDHATIIFGVTPATFTSVDKVSLFACEDNKNVHLIYPDGKVVIPADTRLYLQTLVANKIEGKWKITALKSKQVRSFNTEPRCKA